MARMIYKGSDLPSQLFDPRVPSHTNVDGTVPTAPAADAIVSDLEVCDICGTIFDSQWKPYKNSKGKKVCRLCIDKRGG